MFSYIQKRFAFYGIAGALVTLSLGALFALPLNLGIDMTGGTQTEYKFEGNLQIEEVRTTLDSLRETLPESLKKSISEVSAYTISLEPKFVIQVGYHSDSSRKDAEFEEIKNSLRTSLAQGLQEKYPDANITQTKYVNIGEAFGKYIKNTTVITLLLVVIAISGYITYAFRGAVEGTSSTAFGAVTAISLFHDVVVAAGLYIIASYFFPEFKIDTLFITALLTVLGYSINDTIVIMDRIRTNLTLPEFKKLPFDVTIDSALNSTLERSIYTSSTIFIVLLALFFFGPDAIKGFSLALLFGTIVGTYSSIFIAAPLLYDISKSQK